MSGFSAFPYPGSSIAAEAAESAALKLSKKNSGKKVATSRNDEYRLRRRSRKMAKEFTDAMEDSVKRKLNNMSGPDDNRKRGMKVSQFIPGKGLEIQGAQQHKDSTIYCDLGEKSDTLVDALDATWKTMGGKQISIDFAFKLVNEPDLRSANKKSRISALNLFRHINPDSFNYQKTGSYVNPVNDDQKEANFNWHSTLGPDASYVRRGTDGLTTDGSNAGTWRTSSNDTRSVDGFAKHYNGTTWVVDTGEAAVANSLVSPYRTPSDFEAMYSRINRQVLENYGFALNSFKMRFPGNFNAGAATGTVPPIEPLYVYGNPSVELMNFGATANLGTQGERDFASSFPAQINTQNIVDKARETSPTNSFQEYVEYHSQFGKGKLNYQFSNDGTNPVCIDVCVVGIKKGQTGNPFLLEQLCSFNYGVNKYANQRRMNVNGYQGNVVSDQSDINWNFSNSEWHTDAKLPFMPDECFKNPQSFLKAADYEHMLGNTGTDGNKIRDILEQGRSNPFKLIKRDQFIVSSGATRSWNTTLPSFKYRPEVYDRSAQDPIYPFDISQPSGDLSEKIANQLVPVGDEYTYIFLIGAHGLSCPVEELYPSQTTLPTGSVRPAHEVLKKAIIDHEPTSCSVSVVGTYTETVKPAYPKQYSDRTFINGRLTLPYFSSTANLGDRIEDTENTEYPTRLSSVDISTQGQIVRTTDSGVTGVGAINPAVGA